jgi:hypothetical protein
MKHSHYVGRVAIDFVIELALLSLADLREARVLWVSFLVNVLLLISLEIGVRMYIRLLHLK